MKHSPGGNLPPAGQPRTPPYAYARGCVLAYADKRLTIFNTYTHPTELVGVKQLLARRISAIRACATSNQLDDLVALGCIMRDGKDIGQQMGYRNLEWNWPKEAITTCRLRLPCRRHMWPPFQRQHPSSVHRMWQSSGTWPWLGQHNWTTIRRGRGGHTPK